MVTSDRTKWLALALLRAVQFMLVLNVAIVKSSFDQELVVSCAPRPAAR